MTGQRDGSGMRHPLARLFGGSALLGVGCIVALHFGWLDYLLARVADGGTRAEPTAFLDWAALRMPFLVAAVVGGLGGGYLGRRGGWLSGLIGALICFVMPLAHFTLAGADLGFLLARPELANAMAIGIVGAMLAGMLGEMLAPRGANRPEPEAAPDERRGLGG